MSTISPQTKKRSKCTSSSGCTILVLAGGAGALRIRALAHAWHGGRMVSGEKRKTLGNVFASALRALQPAVGMRACHRIFCCRSSCLRALSVCEPLLCVGVVVSRMYGCSHQLVREELASQWQRAALPDRRWCCAGMPTNVVRWRRPNRRNSRRNSGRHFWDLWDGKFPEFFSRKLGHCVKERYKDF